MYYCIIAEPLCNGLKNKYYSIESKRNTLFQLCDYVFCDYPRPHFIEHPANKQHLDENDQKLFTMTVLGAVPWKGLSEEVVK